MASAFITLLVAVVCLGGSTVTGNVADRSRADVDGLVTWYKNCSGITSIAKIFNMTLTNCDLGNCWLDYDVPQNFRVHFTTGGSHTELLYNLYMTSGMSNYYIAGGSAFRNVQIGATYVFDLDFAVPQKVRNGNNTFEVYLFQPGNPTIYEFCTDFDINGVGQGQGPSPSTPDYGTTSESVSTATAAPTTVVTTSDPETTVGYTTPTPEGTTFSTAVPTTESPVYSTTTAVNETTTPTQGPTSGPSTEYPTSPSPFVCQTSGVFPDPFSCVIYHVCTPMADGMFWDQVLTCAPGTSYCPNRYNCGFEQDCPCWLPF